MIFWINQNVIECNRFSIQDTLKPCRIVKHQQTEIKTAYGEFHKKPAINVSKTEVNRLKVIHTFDLYCENFQNAVNRSVRPDKHYVGCDLEKQNSTDSDGFLKIKKKHSKTVLPEFVLKLSNKFEGLPEEPDDYQENKNTEIRRMRKVSRSSAKIKCQGQVSRSSVKIKDEGSGEDS